MDIATIGIFGLGVGVAAHLLDRPHDDAGVLGSITLGVIGAIVGGIAASLVFGEGVKYLQFSTFMIAGGVALVLLYARKALQT